MSAVVIYESMYGNTHLIAEAIGQGLGSDVVVVPVGQASRELVVGADLVVIGGPTHVHGMVRDSTRDAAIEAAADPAKDLHLDPDAHGEVLRDWFEELGDLGDRAGDAAAFDTRMSGSPALTGRASKGIAKSLRHHGFRVVADPMSFIVDHQNHLLPDQEALARGWGLKLAGARQLRNSR